MLRTKQKGISNAIQLNNTTALERPLVLLILQRSLRIVDFFFFKFSVMNLICPGAIMQNYMQSSFPYLEMVTPIRIVMF